MAGGWARTGGVLSPESFESLLMLMAAASGVGVVKCGLTGLAPATTYAFAIYTPGGPKVGLGLMQPVLIAGDLALINANGFPKGDDLLIIRDLLAFTIVGLGLGYVLLGIVADSVVRRLFGAAILATACRRWLATKKGQAPKPERNADDSGYLWSFVVRATLGVLCGAVSVLTNNSGLLLDAYLLELRLPKARFLTVRSSYLLAAGALKMCGHLIFSVVDARTLPFAACLCFLTVLGVAVGKRVVTLVPQAAFDATLWVFMLVGAARLLIW
eukprot:CAMPEP_0117490980 /NCGR_PEP_ID=MMETSP0784-20121206/17828_1 /TAXON_ID=39447 /ORGANISM="" /LENGTH=270 /DNA_ID=CAMNT_0005285751 /DNA_START=72 /DNA_END=881 /DNA_ORIENTATION=+